MGSSAHVSHRGPRNDEVLYSIVIPVLNEVNNITPLITKIYSVDSRLSPYLEVIFVDDNSQDGTDKVIEDFREKGYNISLIVRKNERGLSGAVIRGFEEARGKYLLCMDGDLQHPPGKAFDLFEALMSDKKFAIGTRYYTGATVYKTWSLPRIIVSKVAGLMAQPITNISDPMTGLFALKREVFEEANLQGLNSKGFKICLELLIKGRVEKPQIAEIPYEFGTRRAGGSKLNLWVMFFYVVELFALYVWKFKRVLRSKLKWVQA